MLASVNMTAEDAVEKDAIQTQVERVPYALLLLKRRRTRPVHSTLASDSDVHVLQPFLLDLEQLAQLGKAESAFVLLRTDGI